MAKGDFTSGFISRLGATVKSIVKMAVQSRRCCFGTAAGNGERLIVMGNGPSLNRAIAERGESLKSNRSLAVNFAANASQFYDLKPDFYVMADPVFFTDLDNDNVKKLWSNLAERVSWPMTLFVPAKVRLPVQPAQSVSVSRFNPVGVEGFMWLEDFAFSRGLGMPRPRNVLIPAIMIGLGLGFKEIYLAGADHSWSKTLEVTDDNVVVSVQPHFYEDNAAEHARVASVYSNVRLHDIMYSFHVAFKSYFTIRRYAQVKGAAVYNSTPGSFIDAFERRPLP